MSVLAKNQRVGFFLESLKVIISSWVNAIVKKKKKMIEYGPETD